MKSILRTAQFIAQFVTLGLAFAFVVSLFAPQSVERLRAALRPAASSPTTAPSAAPAPEPQPKPPNYGPLSPSQPAEAPVSSYALAVSRAAPSVVSIYANRVESGLVQPVLVPNDPQLRESVGAIPVGPPITRQVPTQSLGSGVIVDPDGYALTNYHVIRNAKDIYAVLQDGRVIAAKVIGSDEDSDLTVLHLDGFNMQMVLPAERPAAVGDVVLAIGSPFGLGNTVTMGIVSAIGRQVNPSTGEDFIQTDAAINQGNSGGALVNTTGELVGINSSNYSPSGGSIGIGFAIPVATAKKVLRQIQQHGRVIRAWMGAAYQDIPPKQNDPMPVVTNGVIITAVAPNGPAARAGLVPGDVITRVDDKWVPNQFALRNRESQLEPGSKVSVKGVRAGQKFEFVVTLEEKPQAQQTATSK